MLSRGFLGEHVEYLLQTALGEVRGMAPAAQASAREGDTVRFDLPAQDALALAA